jgi:predicted permease
MGSDFKYAFRQLARSPGFVAVAVLTVALGIGVNATIFGFVRGMVLRPLIRDNRDRIVEVYTGGKSANRDFRRFSYPEFEAIGETKAAFSEVAAAGYATGILGLPGQFQRGIVGLASDHYFSLVHAQALHGRLFSPEEMQPNARIPVTVIGYGFWQRLGAPADLIGGQIRISGQPCLVVGILPPSGASLSIVGPEAWLPLGMAHLLWSDDAPADNPLDAHHFGFSVIARLAPDVSAAAAASRLGGLTRRLNAAPLGDPAAPRELLLAPPPRFSFGEEAPEDEWYLVPFALVATVLAATVLLVACLNLANMLFARGLARRKEIAIRLSLGATRGQIVRQLMAESLVLAAAGGLVGFLLFRASGTYFQHLGAEDFAATRFDFAGKQSADFGDILVTAILVIGSALAFGLAPALRATRVDLVDDLKRQPGQPAEGGRWNRFFSARHCRMMGQIALSFMLLFSAGLFVRGTHNAINRNPGFAKTGEWVINFDYLDPNLHSTAIARREQAMVDRAAAIPGIQSAAVAGAVPFDYDTDRRRIYPAGGVGASLGSNGLTPEAAPWSVLTTVSRGYFGTVGIPLLAGRDFSAAESQRDSGHHVAIIDASLARALFGDQNPIGRRLAFSVGDAGGPAADRQTEVIGLVRSPHEDVFEAAAPHRIYTPLGPWSARNVYLHVKIGDPATAPAVLERLRRELLTLDPDNPPLRTQPLGDFLDKNPKLLLVRLAGMTFGAAGIVALVLAVIGVYSVKAHAVARRTREMGIRIALGARPGEIMSLILTQGIQQTVVGLAAGLVLAVFAGRLAAKMLYQVQPLDPLTLAAAAIALSVTVLLACWLPARRATGVDPAITLRSE